ncbi:MAG: response regulator [Pirellulales bacterium]|nr:response regulator [Pirellulales bacterium]
MTISFSDQPVVYLIDDQPEELLLTRHRCEANDLRVETYLSAASFLSEVGNDARGCVVADLLMPEMSGLQLNEELRRRGVQLPMVVLTGYPDTRSCRTAFKSGVFDFVAKSVHWQELIGVIQRALRKNEQESIRQRLRETFLTQLDKLSPREKEVMYLLADGKSLKEIAGMFEISVQTASKHRVRLFHKLDIHNEVTLLKMLIAVDPSHGVCQSVA